MESSAAKVEMSDLEAQSKRKTQREVFLKDPAAASKERLETAKAKFMPESGVNPFEARTVGIFSSPLRSLKTIILIPLVVVRVCGLVVCLILGAFFLSLGVALACLKPEINGTLQALPLRTRVCLWLCWPCIRGILFCMGYQWVSWTGRPAPKSEAPIMVPSHSGWAEGFYLVGKLWPTGLGQIQSFSAPLYGTILKLLQFVAVDRDDADSRKQSAQLMKERCADPDCPLFLIFPEGATSSGTHLLQFKDGPFRPGLPVQAVGIFYPYEKACSDYHPYGDPFNPAGVILHIFRALWEFHNPMHIHWCDPYIPSEEEKNDSHLYARNVRRHLAEKSGKLLTEHAFEDVRLALVAKKDFKVKNTDWVFVEMGKVYDQLHFNLNDAKAILARFENIDVKRAGVVDRDQFLSALELPRTPLTEQLFTLYDLDGDGTVNFREYMFAQAMFRGINDGSKREDEREAKGSALNEESLDFMWYVVTGCVEGRTAIEFDDLKGIFERYALQPREGTTIRELFDKAKGDRATFDREAFDSMMWSSPEYVQLFRLGEKNRPN